MTNWPSTSGSSGAGWASPHYSSYSTGGGGGGGGGGGLGGFLGDLASHIPGADVASGLYHGAISTGENFGLGIANIPIQSVASIEQGLQHPLYSVEHPGTLPFYQKLVKPVGLAYKGKYGSVFEHPLSPTAWHQTEHNILHDPFGSFLDALTVATVPFTAGDSLSIRGATMTMDAGRIAKLNDIARLPTEERAAAMAKAGETSLRARRYVAAVSHRLPITRQAELIPGAEPTPYQVHPAVTPWGRALQSKTLDILESTKPVRYKRGLEEPVPFVNTPFGAGGKISRLANVRITRESAAYLQEAKKTQALLAPLSAPEQIALKMAREGTDPLATARMYEAEYAHDPNPHLAEVIQALKDPAVQDVIRNPSEEFLKADAALHKLSTDSTQRFIARGDVTPENAAMRAILPQRVVGSDGTDGARFEHSQVIKVPKTDEYATERKAAKADISSARRRIESAHTSFRKMARPQDVQVEHQITQLEADLQDLRTRLAEAKQPIDEYQLPKPAEFTTGRKAAADSLQAEIARAERNLGRLTRRRNLRGKGAFKAAQQELSDARDAYRAAHEYHRGLPPPTPAHTIETEAMFHGGPDVQQLLGQTENPLNPAFKPVSRFPHTVPIGKEKEAGIHTGLSLQRGVTAAERPGVLKRSTGERYLSGEHGFSPQQVVNDYLQTSRYEHKLQIHNYLWNEVARPATDELPGGKHPSEFYIRKNPGTTIPRDIRDQEALMRDFGKPGDRASERVAARKITETLGHEAKNEVFNSHEIPADLGHVNFNSAAELEKAGIRRLPPSFAHSYRDTFGGGSNLRHLDQFLAGWRMVQLAKPGYAVHNIVQQHALFAIRYGARGYRDMIRLIRDPAAREALAERTPGLALSGGYGQLGRGVHSGALAEEDVARVAKAAKISHNVVRQGLSGYWKFIHDLNIKYAENLPREAAVYHMLDHMRQAGESFAEMAKRVDPQDVEIATNDALRFLGDFGAMTRWERKVAARAFPLLYPWFRTILAVSAHLIKDYPGRVLLIKALGDAVPKEQQPSWLKGSIPIGTSKGIETLIQQGPINPFGTFSQVADEPIASQMNPVAQAAVLGLSGQDPFTGATYKGIGAQSGPSLSADVSRGAGSFFGSLPPVTIGSQVLGGVRIPGTNYAPIHKARPSKTYTNQQMDALYAFLGLPIKHVRRREAAAEAKQGR